jgi:hypothetical protein
VTHFAKCVVHGRLPNHAERAATVNTVTGAVVVSVTALERMGCDFDAVPRDCINDLRVDIGPFLVSEQSTTESHTQLVQHVTVLHPVVFAAHCKNLLQVARKCHTSSIFVAFSFPFPFPFSLALSFISLPIICIMIRPEVSEAMIEEKMILRYDVRVDLEHALPNVPRQQIWFQSPETDPSLSVQESPESNVVK